MNWIRQNKLATFLIIIVLVLVLRNYLSGLFGVRLSSLPKQSAQIERMDVVSPSTKLGASMVPAAGGGIYPRQEYAPTERTDRLVVEESSMSLVTMKVQEVADKVVNYAKQAGGFMVSTSLTGVEEVPFATVVVRVPEEKFKETLDYCRKLAIRVVSENILGTDVTAEYVDIEARLATLQKTKSKFESIMEQATQIQDILQVQRELVSLQDQIDALKGRQKYLEQTAKLSKITVYLSADELALPYAPAKPFRPEAIFKQAVRSLVGTLRGLAKAGIWIGVYSVVWLPVVVIILLVRKWRKRKPALIK